MTLEQTGKLAVNQNIRGLMNLLQGFAPFNQMQAAHLGALIESSSLVFFAANDEILGPESGIVEYFYIIKQGFVRGERYSEKHHRREETFSIGSGDCFPLGALIGERATRTHHIADSDVFCLKVNKKSFIDAFTTSDVFRDFCLRGVSSLLDVVNQKIRTHAAETLGTEHSLDTPLAELAVRNPIVCPPDTPLRKAIAIMHANNVGSIIITDELRRPSGIFTLRDLRRIIAENSVDFDDPIARAMTVDPCSLPFSASAFEAALTMAKYHFAHLCLVDEDGSLKGVVSERDLFSLQRVNLVHLARTIANAHSISTLQSLRSDITRLIETMIAQGAAAQQLNHIITLLNDYTVVRVIELTLKELGDPGIPFTWLVFGSEGRKEQTLVTDQDNGILFQTPMNMNAEQVRQVLLPLAQRINEHLDQIGFTWCKGNIMASNPSLCLSVQEWEQWYNRFIDAATPENLLNSSIFLDMRPIWGESSAANAMFERVVQRIRKHSLFQKMMAASALQHRPPLNLFRGFVYAKGGEKHTLDLKTQGLTPFVDGARILALAEGIIAANTIERLEALSRSGKVNNKDVSAWIEAYNLIQMLRMRNHQDQNRQQKPASNRIDPDQLNQLDSRILRESFRQAQRLQQKLELTFSL